VGEFTMPSLGADMDAGTVVQWLVAPGDHVERGDVVAVVDTDKADIEVEVFESGVVDRIVVPAGERVDVGHVLAVIRPDEAIPRKAPREKSRPRSEAPTGDDAEPRRTPTPDGDRGREGDRMPPRLAVIRAEATEESPARPAPRTGPVAHPSAAGRVAASPFARRRAEELGVDLADVARGRAAGPLHAADVEARVPGVATPVRPRGPSDTATAPPAPPARREPGVSADRLAAMRRATATLMERSKREIPHFYVASDIELGATLRWLTERNETRPIAERVLPAALLLRAVALAARREPDLNGFWVDDHFEPSPAVQLGVAVALRQGGLLAPAIHDADALGLDALMGALRDLVARARTGSLRASELAAPTITVTNLGEQGADTVYPVIHAPQVAIVGFGRITDRPWASDGMIGVRPVVTATLAADHRVSDGHVGARFLAALERLLHDPAALEADGPTPA
jgi:pyruvate dehydrogenase E2 component (dihydrolipoamide acetyltransferase)